VCLDDLGKAVKTETVTILNKLAHNSMSAHILEKCFILLSFKAGHLYTKKQSKKRVDTNTRGTLDDRRKINEKALPW
jgi:hypothetical protein